MLYCDAAPDSRRLITRLSVCGLKNQDHCLRWLNVLYHLLILVTSLWGMEYSIWLALHTEHLAQTVCNSGDIMIYCLRE